MKLFVVLFLLAIISSGDSRRDLNQTPANTQAQSTPNAEIDLELRQVAKLYRAGNFVEAQRHAERAVELDPTNRIALTFLARVKHQQFKPGDDTPENVAHARAAIADYQRLLALDAQNEESYKAIAVLYSVLHEEQLLRAWLLQRASNAQVSYEKRAEAYAALAGRFWDCSFKITELPAQKMTEQKGKRLVISYLKPKDPVEFENLKQCVAGGLEMADMAVALDSNSETAWLYKSQLLLENAKLAEMEGAEVEKENFLKLAGPAKAEWNKLVAERRKREEEKETGPPLNIAPPPRPRVSPSP